MLLPREMGAHLEVTLLLLKKEGYRPRDWSVSGVRPALSLLCRLAVLRGSWAKSPSRERTGPWQ